MSTLKNHFPAERSIENDWNKFSRFLKAIYKVKPDKKFINSFFITWWLNRLIKKKLKVFKLEKDLNWWINDLRM